jgi:hypothetical protein
MPLWRLFAAWFIAFSMRHGGGMAEIAGRACLERIGVGVPGVLEISVEDVSLLDAPSVTMFVHREAITAERYRLRDGLPCVPFRFTCRPPEGDGERHDLALTARLYAGRKGQAAHTLEAGDFATTRRTNVPANLAGRFDLLLEPVGGG